MSFTLIQVGDTIYDKELQVTGEVLEIDRTFAKIKKNNDSLTLSSLHNLIQVKDEREEVSCSYDYNKWFHQAKEFHKAFNHPVGDIPKQLTPPRALDRSVWKMEEIIEFLAASVMDQNEFLHLYDRLLEGMEDAKQKSLRDGFPDTNKQKLVAQSDALIDTLYFIMGSLVEMKIEPDKLFDIVQNSNMSKLFTAEDGTKYAKYRESDGKILKSPEFFDPEPLLKEEIERQINTSQ